jgi:glyoxylase-like metal-dependent hydrolase (beta-lactamase superfamily II)
MSSVRLPIADNWYEINSYPDNIFRITEKHIDSYWSGNIWLVVGSSKALVVDTGTGIVPPNTIVSSITHKPVIAVALCCFYDHSGGLYSFDERACHHLEADAVVDSSNDKLASYFVKNAKLSALPYKGFSLECYEVKSTKLTRTFQEGEIIDLGDRRLEVLHIPGRTPGSIALWEENAGYLFGGESLFIDPDKNDFPPQDVISYENSLFRLAELPVVSIFGGHFECFSSEELHQLIKLEIGRYH